MAKMVEEEKLPCSPLADFVLVRLILEKESEGGIVLPDKKIRYGMVKSIGPGVDAKLYMGNKDSIPGTRGMSVGDKVFLPRGENGGTRFGDYLLVQASFITAIMND